MTKRGSHVILVTAAYELIAALFSGANADCEIRICLGQLYAYAKVSAENLDAATELSRHCEVIR